MSRHRRPARRGPSYPVHRNPADEMFPGSDAHLWRRLTSTLDLLAALTLAAIANRTNRDRRNPHGIRDLRP